MKDSISSTGVYIMIVNTGIDALKKISQRTWLFTEMKTQYGLMVTGISTIIGQTPILKLVKNILISN